MAGYQGTAGGGEWRPNDTHNINANVQKSQGAHYDARLGIEFRVLSREPPRVRQQHDRPLQLRQQLDPRTAVTIRRARRQHRSVRGSVAAGHSDGGGIFRPRLTMPSSPRRGASSSRTTGRYTPKLTLNLGLRWEFETALDRAVQPQRARRSTRNAAFSVGAQAQASLCAESRFCSVPRRTFYVKRRSDLRRCERPAGGLYNTPKRNLMPRFGFAYQLNNNTVLRGGYGIFSASSASAAATSSRRLQPQTRTSSSPTTAI